MTTKILIEKVQKYPILFNSLHEDHKNPRKKDLVWEQIGRELNISGDETKKKWKNIKDSYGKYLRSLSSTAEGISRKNYAHWQWAKNMEPLKPFIFKGSAPFCHIDLPEESNQADGTGANYEFEEIQIKSEGSNPLEDLGDVDDHIITINKSDIPLSLAKSDSSKSCSLLGKRKLNIEEAENSFSSTNLRGHNESRKKHKTKLDGMGPNDLIFLGYAKLISNFSTKRQATTKLKIAEIIMEQEILHGEELSIENKFLSRASSPSNQSQMSSSSNNWP